MAAEASSTFSCATTPPSRVALGHAMREVVLQQLQRDGLQGLGRGGDLGQDVDLVVSDSIMRCSPRT